MGHPTMKLLLNQAPVFFRGHYFSFAHVFQGDYHQHFGSDCFSPIRNVLLRRFDD